MSATPAAVLSADTHLAPHAWAKHPGLAGDSYYGLQQIVDYCTSNELELILAGDIFDRTRPDAATAHVMRTQLDRMARQSLSVFAVQGQHERAPDVIWLNAISWWPTHVHKKSFQLCPGINGYGIDWTAADTVQEEFQNIPDNTDLLVAHQVWRDLMGPRIGDSECAFADVPRVNTILTGDFHRHLTLTAIGKDAQRLQILSPGPTCMQSIDEDPHKRFFVMCDDLSVSSVSFKTRQCFRITINTKDDLEVFLSGNVEALITPQENVPANIAKNIVHISYQDDIPEAYTRITSAIGTQAHLFLVPIRHKPEVITIENERRRVLADGGLEACLELLVEPGTALYKDVLSLLRSMNPHEQLNAIRAAFLSQNGGENNDRGAVRDKVQSGNG